MANFKALSSGFVFDTVLLLLLVVINCVYPAASCGSNSSEVMLFKSSPLKVVVEEVARDQQTTTEIAIDDHDEIQAGRVLQGVGGQVWKFLNKFKSPFKGVKPAYKSFEESKDKLDLAKDIPNYFNDLKNYLDSNYCVLPYCYPDTQRLDYCRCQEEEDPTRRSGPCKTLTPVFYCCQGTDTTCSYCCAGKDGGRDILNITTSPSSTTPTGVSSISSSQSPPIILLMLLWLLLQPSFLFN